MTSALLTLILLRSAQKEWPQAPIAAAVVKTVEGKELSLPVPKMAATVVLFVTVDCPITNRYAPEIQRIVTKYKDRVGFALAYTDRALSPQQVKKHQKEYSLSAPAFLDHKHIWVKKLGASVTPEAALFSPAGKLLYRGRIDDLYKSAATRRPKAERADLRIAIEETLAGKKVSEPMMAPVGCAISNS